MKQKCPEFENHERWLISFADMLTLLFATFVVLYSLNITSEKSESKAAGSMQESFNTPLEDIPVDREGGPQEHGFGIFEHFRGDQIRAPMVKKFPKPQERSGVVEMEMKTLKARIEERLYGPEKFRSSEKPGNERIVDVERTEKGFKLRLMARYFFAPGEVNVTNEARKNLDIIIGLIKELGRKVVVEGHTDNLPPKGSASNWEVSALRATNIAKHMLRHHEFPASLISVAGYADLRPIASNGTEAGRNLNNRVEFQLEYDDVETLDPR